MTDKQLEKLDLYREGKMSPNKYWSNTTQSTLIIFRSATLESVATQIFEEGVSQGVEKGMRKRSEQISDLLNNRDIN